jgi:hypothetical protein
LRFSLPGGLPRFLGGSFPVSFDNWRCNSDALALSAAETSSRNLKSCSTDIDASLDSFAIDTPTIVGMRVDNPIKLEGKHAVVGTIANSLPYGHGNFLQRNGRSSNSNRQIMTMRALKERGTVRRSLRAVVSKMGFPLDSDDL